MKPVIAAMTLFFLANSPTFKTSRKTSRSSHETASQKPAPAVKTQTLTGQLVAVEREFWEAWKNKQPSRAANAMAENAVFYPVRREGDIGLRLS